jgi:outer membrane protein OmpU
MNKLMLSAAAVALTLAVSPAFAQEDAGVKLGLGGFFKGYVNYSDESTDRTIDILRSTEVHFGGETTLDNGLTVGAHIEATADTGDSFDMDETYVYFAGSWGRVNVGEEDGAAYLLQVAAPAADDNIDGLRQYINPVSFFAAPLDYANDIAKDTDKFTYLSPVFSGFQAGISYSPEVVDDIRSNDGNAPFPIAGVTDDVIELAARYEGMVSDVGVIVGAGYTTANNDVDEWNVGADLDIGAFGLGVVYTSFNNDAATVSSESDIDSDTWVVGGDYTTGPFKLGVSYLNYDEETASVESADADRVTGGVVYTYGPGMTFRGSIARTDEDVADVDATTVTVGTQINF